MRRNRSAALLIAGTALAVGMASAAERVDVGKREFDGNCASCHGSAGKGNGPYQPYLTRSPSDLTMLAKQNGGVFPLERVARTIDGRQDVPAHGPRDMPVWGRDYSIRAAEYYIDVPYDADAFVRARILALSEYVNRLQAK